MAAQYRAKEEEGAKHPDHEVHVSSKRNSNFFVFLGKKALESNQTIELHALGNAIQTSVVTAQNLVR